MVKLVQPQKETRTRFGRKLMIRTGPRAGSPHGTQGQGKHWVLVKGHKIGVRGKPEPDLDWVGFFFFFLIGVLMGEARYSRVSSLGLACWNNLEGFTIGVSQVFPGGSDVKASACNGRDPGFDPWFGKIPWRRKWQPTPVLLPGKSHGQRSMVGYIPWSCKESD